MRNTQLASMDSKLREARDSLSKMEHDEGMVRM